MPTLRAVAVAPRSLASVRPTCDIGIANRSSVTSQRCKRYRATVLFDTVGYKTLSVPVVVEQHLLTTS